MAKMCFIKKIYIVWILCLLWITHQSYSEQDYNTCSFYYWKVDWESANNTCETDNKKLLCYNSKKEIDDITEAFRLSAYGDAELELWLSHRNCSRPDEEEKCLSLHIQKSGSSIWHFFQSDCRNRLPFVCCIKEGNMSTTTPWTSMPSSLHTDTSPTTTVQTSTLANHCHGQKRRGLYWPNTKFGQVAILPCPGNSVGEAKWVCESQNGGRWRHRGPDFSKCRSLDVINIKDKMDNSSVSETISLIENVFKDQEKEIFVEDLVDIVSIMKVLPDKMSLEMDKLPLHAKWSLISDTVEKSASLVDSMVELHNTWSDVEMKQKPIMGTDLLSSVDGFGILLADTMADDIVEKSVIGKNMALQVLRTKYGESMELPQWTVTSHYSKKSSIVLDEGYDKHLNPALGNIAVVFTLYSNLSGILQPQVSQKNQWSTWGCRAEGNNASYTLCVCDHLTNFAVLMDFKGVLDDVDQLAFNWITIIGCSLSIICLSFCVVVFSCYSYHSKHSWGLRYVIHRNLCLTLLIANLVLILGIDKTDDENLCAVVAGMLHYFFLSAFSWMLLEGVHIYMLLVVVFASRRSHWEKYYLFGYGFPLIVVAITAIARPTYYGTDEACWLSTEKGTIFAFMGPVACILILNVAALILAQYKASNISVKNDNVALVKRWLRITFILFPVLGITWLLGFMYVERRFIVIGYLFAIFNSLQGFGIFVCHCLLDKKARNMVLASFKKKSASVNTGSSGTQKKNITKDTIKDELDSAQNGAAINTGDMNKSSLLSFKKSKKAWVKWHKPWTFCFDMPVADSDNNSTYKTTETPTRPVILQWNNLGDKPC
nr:latrophilin-like protein 1 isoform X2 [Parasteatoda tepidariorum]